MYRGVVGISCIMYDKLFTSVTRKSDSHIFSFRCRKSSSSDMGSLHGGALRAVDAPIFRPNAATSRPIASIVGSWGFSSAAKCGNMAFSSTFSGGLRCRVRVGGEEVVSGIVAAVGDGKLPA